MLKLLNLIFFSLIINVSLAQKSEIINVSVKYKVNYSKDKEILVNDICQLDITKNNSFFYSVGTIEEATAMIKRIEKSETTNIPFSLKNSDIRRDLYKFNTIKNYAKDISIVTEFVGEQLLGYVRDTLSSLKWSITKEIKTINNISCRKAEITIGTIKAVAWFAINIPIQEGPFFYYGLPGLIIKLNNNLGWSAELISIIYPKEKKIDIYPYKLVSKIQLNKAKKNSESMLKNGIVPGFANIEKEN